MFALTKQIIAMMSATEYLLFMTVSFPKFLFFTPTRSPTSSPWESRHLKKIVKKKSPLKKHIFVLSLPAIEKG
tara:strand:+ start:380 stop:598 length:219 start_codon:yes stop_codon:yes gene_type:complete